MMNRTLHRISWRSNPEGRAGSITVVALDVAQKTAASLAARNYQGVELHVIEVSDDARSEKVLERLL